MQLGHFFHTKEQTMDKSYDYTRQIYWKPMLCYSILKRIMDITFSFFGILFSFPIMLMIVLLIKFESTGPAIYKQERVGYLGEKFYIFKFRTMFTDERPRKVIFSKEQRDRFRKEYKLNNDPRITKIGRILRITSLDELPQLFNILLGDMSLVGPRPVLQTETEFYGMNRDLLLSVTPGLTGYWQAYGRNNVTYDDGRMEMELYYVRNQSLILDIKILIQTVISVICQKGAQ